MISFLFPRFTKIVTATGVLLPEPKIFPPSLRDNSPDVR
jgi:hypothetical protein